MMKHLIVFLTLVFCAQTSYAASEVADPKLAVAAFKTYCLGAIENKSPVADYAVKQGLKEVTGDDAKKFSPQGGRVFMLPKLSGMAMLMTNPTVSSVCNIALHKTVADTLKDHIFTLLGKTYPFSFISEKRNDLERVSHLEFHGTLNGDVKVLVSVSDSPRPNGIQALMTSGYATP